MYSPINNRSLGLSPRDKKKGQNMAKKKGKAYAFPISVSFPSPEVDGVMDGECAQVNWDHNSLTWLSRFDSISTDHRWTEERVERYPISMGSVNIQTEVGDQTEETLPEFVGKLSEVIGSDVCAYLVTVNDKTDQADPQEFGDTRIVQILVPLDDVVSNPDHYRGIVAWIRHKARQTGLGNLGGLQYERQQDPSAVFLTEGRGPLKVKPVLKEVPDPVKEPELDGDTLVERDDGEFVTLGSLENGAKIYCPICKGHPLTDPNSKQLARVRVSDTGSRSFTCPRCIGLGNGWESRGWFKIVDTKVASSVSD